MPVPPERDEPTPMEAYPVSAYTSCPAWDGACRTAPGIISISSVPFPASLCCSRPSSCGVGSAGRDIRSLQASSFRDGARRSARLLDQCSYKTQEGSMLWSVPSMREEVADLDV